jgi:hypothetical protein
LSDSNYEYVDDESTGQGGTQLAGKRKKSKEKERIERKGKN